MKVPGVVLGLLFFPRLVLATPLDTQDAADEAYEELPDSEALRGGMRRLAATSQPLHNLPSLPHDLYTSSLDSLRHERPHALPQGPKGVPGAYRHPPRTGAVPKGGTKVVQTMTAEESWTVLGRPISTPFRRQRPASGKRPQVLRRPVSKKRPLKLMIIGRTRQRRPFRQILEPCCRPKAPSRPRAPPRPKRLPRPKAPARPRVPPRPPTPMDVTPDPLSLHNMAGPPYFDAVPTRVLSGDGDLTPGARRPDVVETALGDSGDDGRVRDSVSWDDNAGHDWYDDWSKKWDRRDSHDLPRGASDGERPRLPDALFTKNRLPITPRTRNGHARAPLTRSGHHPDRLLPKAATPPETDRKYPLLGRDGEVLRPHRSSRGPSGTIRRWNRAKEDLAGASAKTRGKPYPQQIMMATTVYSEGLGALNSDIGDKTFTLPDLTNPGRGWEWAAGRGVGGDRPFR